MIAVRDGAELSLVDVFPDDTIIKLQFLQLAAPIIVVQKFKTNRQHDGFDGHGTTTRRRRRDGNERCSPVRQQHQ